MRVIWWLAIGLGVLAILVQLTKSQTPATAPLNASGYTYPSTPGA